MVRDSGLHPSVVQLLSMAAMEDLEAASVPTELAWVPTELAWVAMELALVVTDPPVAMEASAAMARWAAMGATAP
jgi:hypothetical protein